MAQTSPQRLAISSPPQYRADMIASNSVAGFSFRDSPARPMTMVVSAAIRRERDRKMGGAHQGGERHGRMMLRRPFRVPCVTALGRYFGAVLAVAGGLG
jgi:hypothetical protein